MKTKKIVPIKYTSRDFASIRNDLKEYAKKFYPDTYKDFSEASFGALMFDSVAYVGDVLSYALDFACNESFLDTAVEYNNVIRLARQSGYKFKGNPSSYGTATFYVMVPASTTGLGPDTRYEPILQKGSSFATPGGTSFILNEDVNFKDSTNEVVVGRVNSVTGVPTYYAVRAYGEIISGELARQTVTVGNFEKFLRVPLDGDDIAEVLSVFDAEGHEYYEVEHLSQNVIYRPIVNVKSTKDQVSAIMKPFAVARRFTVERERQKTYLQFGYGSDSELEDSSVVDPTDVVLNVYGKSYISDDSFDPSNLMSSDKFGIAPADTVLTIVYRINTSDNVNAGVGSVNKVISAFLKFEDPVVLDQAQINFVYSSLEVENEEPILGDVSLPSSEELKIRANGVFMSQGRAVTELDYKALAYNMPPKFGAVKRVAVYRDNGSFRRNLNLYVISESTNGSLVAANDDLKRNLKTWLNRNKMLSDTIDILDAKIINFGIEFEVVPKLDRNKYDVIAACAYALEEHYTQKFDIGENINISEIYTILNRVESVQDTVDVKIVLKSGGVYSDVRVNIDDLKSADGRYIEIPDNAIAELKFANLDIKGGIR
jgi:hypothetical protein